MGLVRTSLLVLLSCAVMSAQAANFNQPKAADIKVTINREPIRIIDIQGAQEQLCVVPKKFQRARQYQGFNTQIRISQPGRPIEMMRRCN